MINSIKQAEKLSKKYEIPAVDIILTGLNLAGVKKEGNDSRMIRGRFKANTSPLDYNWPFFFAVTIDNTSLYRHDGMNVWLGKDKIATASGIVNDTCDETYVRKGGKALTLNSNGRSSCKGCKFCGTYDLDSADLNDLTTRKAMEKKAEELLNMGIVGNYSEIESIGVVTGCFKNEQKLLEHLVMIRRVFGNLGFNGEIRYIGSQLVSEKSFDVLAKHGKFSLYLTVECFERRNLLMSEKKSSLTLEAGRNVLKYAKSLGMDTCLLYILGLDSPRSIDIEFPKYVDVLTRHPLINVMQLYVPEHKELRHAEAHEIDYYLKARLRLEEIFSKGKWPQGYDNYRSPWFTTYNKKPIRLVI